MQRSTLVVDDDEARRRSLVHALSRRGLRYLDVADAFGAMAALGRADFGAVIATEGRRTLSLRGLCQLARRRHPDVVIFVIHREGSDAKAIPEILGTHVDILEPTLAAEGVAAAVENALSAPHATTGPFDHLPKTSEALAVFDEDPTVKTPIAPTNLAQQPTAKYPAPTPTPAVVTGSGTGATPASLEPDEPTERVERTLPNVNAAGAPAPITLPSSVSGPVPVQPPPMGPLLEGGLEGGSGPALLMGIFTQELTGRLLLQGGPAVGTLYFYRGEPVWADDPGGDAGLFRRLVQKGKLKPDTALEAVAEGQLLGALIQKGLLSAAQMHEFMRELVRDGVLNVATASVGSYRFDEDRNFLDVAPLLRVNPFGLVLESRRKVVSPAQLLAMSNEIEGKFVVPGPGLGASSDKLAPFVRGARLGHVIDGTKTVRQVLEYTSLDQFMGTLVMLSLQDTKLVSFADQPRASDAGGVTLNDSQLTAADPLEVTLVDAEIVPDGSTSEEESKAREEILGLYMRLKPLTVPRAVLGVGIDADATEIEAAFQARMKELDPTKIPEGSAQQLLSTRVEELRKKVMSAYQALKLQAVSSANTGVVDANAGKSKTNPF